MEMAVHEWLQMQELNFYVGEILNLCQMGHMYQSAQGLC
jgi:hypothetical protein